MKHIYFDQNIANDLCNNPDFSNQFLNQAFKSPSTLIITPHSLIELSGETINNCLKENSKFTIDTSNPLSNQSDISNQVDKAFEYYYENNIKENIISFLEEALKQNKGKYTNTKHGKYILTEYENYLNSEKAEKEISYNISVDRVSALPLEEFKHRDTYLHIMSIALSFCSHNPCTPILRLVIKSYKRLPHPSSEQENNEFRMPLRKMLAKADLHENSDLVDTEMIQLAIMGYDKNPVHFYTKDDSEQIKCRLHFLYMILKVVKAELQTSLKDGTYSSDTKNISLEKAKKIASLDFIFGKFSIVDKFGHIKEEFDVKSVVDTPIEVS